MFTQAHNLRCADCGTDDILLEGQGKWNAELQHWVIPDQSMELVGDGLWPVDDATSFFCRACGNICPVKLGD